MRVIVFPTWRCGLNCPYCRYELQEDRRSTKYLGSGHLYKVDRELTSDELKQLLLGFDGAEFSFSGGEPLRFEGIDSVLNSLPNWSITSNTLHFSNNLDLTRCRWWTASFHPHISDEAKDLFFLNLRKIKSKVSLVSVTLVASLTNLNQAFIWANRFETMGYGVNIHPYYDDPSFNWYEHEKELTLLKKNKFVCYGERLLTYSGIEGSIECHGGYDYITIAPDGKVFRCLTDMLFGRAPILRENIGKMGLYSCYNKCYFPCDWSFGMREG